jgi:Ca2+-binding RTX toxin-like protein
VGSAGNDTLDGGAGQDVADYTTLGGPVTLGAFGVVNKGLLGVDRLVAIETIVGSAGGGDTVDHSGAAAPATGTSTNLGTGQLVVNGAVAPLPLSFTVRQFENVIGSSFADTITGDLGNNVLRGGLGNDTLDGGLGVDTASYAGATAGVSVTLASQGVVQFTGVTGLDVLVGMENLTGSNFADNLSGDAGSNTLSGGLGNDILTGGLGADQFHFDAVGTTNQDTITDFNVLQGDRIGLSASVFLGIGAPGAVLGLTQFLAGAGVLAATTLTQRILHNTTTGGLFWDRDGSAAVFSAVQFGTLAPVAAGLTNNQFVLV